MKYNNNNNNNSNINLATQAPSLSLLSFLSSSDSTIPNWLSDLTLLSLNKKNAIKRRLFQYKNSHLVQSKIKKLLQFEEDHRPPWFGKMKKNLVLEWNEQDLCITPHNATAAPIITNTIAYSASSSSSSSSSFSSPSSIPSFSRYLRLPRARRPSARWSLPPTILNYDIDSEAEWGDEPEDAVELADDSECEEDSEEEEEEREANKNNNGGLRGDGLLEDGWLVPENEDPLANKTHNNNKENNKSNNNNNNKNKSKIREIMLPIVVGPFMSNHILNEIQQEEKKNNHNEEEKEEEESLDFDSLIEIYLKEQLQLASDVNFKPTIQLNDDQKELLSYRKRILVNSFPVDFEPIYPTPTNNQINNNNGNCNNNIVKRKEKDLVGQKIQILTILLLPLLLQQLLLLLLLHHHHHRRHHHLFLHLLHLL